MIIKAFSEYLHSLPEDFPPVDALLKWIKSILSKNPDNHIENVIHTEISLKSSDDGLFLLIAKSKTGQNLIEALYNFALSFENHKFAKWLHETKASDFKQ